MAASPRPHRGGGAPLARHGILPSRHPLVTMLAMLGVVLGVVGVSATGLAAYSVWDAAQSISANAVVLDEDKALPPSLGAIEGGVNLLIVGSDSCEGQDVALFPRCANDDSPGERNDVTMLVHI